MDYLKHYNRLIARGKVRGWTKQSAPCYTEQHHIIPKCVMKDNSTGNLVTLTAEEHFVAHLLLVKIYKDTKYKHKLVYAANAMRLNNPNQQRVTNKEIGWLRRKAADASKRENLSEETLRKKSEASKRENLSEETLKKMSESNKRASASKDARRKRSESRKGKVASDETKKKLSEASKGRIVSEETRRKISEARKGTRRSEETRLKISESGKGRVVSNETRYKISVTQKNRLILICPHCDLQGKNSGNMKRYHFDNCKHKQ